MKKISVKEIVTLAIMSALMITSKLLMEFLPNIHLLGFLIVTTTVIFRSKALFAIYTFVLINGFLAGFAPWWIPYLYIWTLLWGAVMLVPKKLPEAVKNIIYIILCGLHGFLFGTLYAPAQALLFGLDFNGMIAWIISGLPFDIIHGISNLCTGLLIHPIITVLKNIQKYLDKN